MIKCFIRTANAKHLKNTVVEQIQFGLLIVFQ